MKGEGVTNELLIQRLEGQRGRLKRLYLSHGLVQIVLRGLVLCTGLFLLDYSMEPPRGIRVLLALLGTVYMGYVVYRYFIYPLTRRITCSDIANALERRFPELDGSLVSALEFQTLDTGRLGAVSPSLLQAATAMGAEKAEKVRWEALFDSSVIRKLAFAASAFLVLTGGYAFMRPD
ncbi:MAG: hypothetical protein ABIK28_20435, partial [Planctomycetota bacterium]